MAQGNVEAVLDSAQAVVAAYRYDPFGVLLNKTGSFEQPYGFSTKRYNARVGMVQYEFRNYWPEIGLWDRRDPLGEAGGLNLYAFVGNNPVNWVDPYGLATSGWAANLANQWDGYAGQTQNIMFGLVDHYPNAGAITLATLTNTAVGIGAGFVDMLRLGEGVVEGGVRGCISDAARLAGFVAIGGEAFQLVRGGVAATGVAEAATAGGSYSDDARALIELAKRAKRTGISIDDARTLLDWAGEFKVKPALDHIGTNHWVGGSHIRIGSINHIPVR